MAPEPQSNVDTTSETLGVDGADTDLIILSGKPESTNSLYRNSCRGGKSVTYMTKAGKATKEQYVLEAKTQYKKDITDEDVALSIVLYMPDKRRRDIDNYFKLVLDALEGIVYEDDSQIQRMTVEKLLDREEPRVEVDINF